MKKYYITDIGELTYEEGYLNKKIEIVFFGNKKNANVSFSIESKTNINISDVQKMIYFELINDLDNVIYKIEQKIYDYYMNFVLKNTDYIDLWIIDDLPEIKTINDMEKIVSEPDFFIEDQSEDEEHNISVIFESMWDDQYGLAIWLVNNEIYQIGNGAEVL